MTDSINPRHYKTHASGLECIDITEHLTFNLGNAIKYIFRRNLKNNTIEDLNKAIWYLDREAQRIGNKSYDLGAEVTANMALVADAEPKDSPLWYVLVAFLSIDSEGNVRGYVHPASLRFASMKVRHEVDRLTKGAQ